MATTYKFNGSKQSWDKTSRLILEGSSGEAEPARYVDKGGTIELSDEEYESLKGSYKLSRVGDEQTPQGEEQKAGSNEPQTPAEQQEAQVASGAQHAAATTDKDNTPAGRQAKAR